MTVESMQWMLLCMEVRDHVTLLIFIGNTDALVEAIADADLTDSSVCNTYVQYASQIESIFYLKLLFAVTKKIRWNFS